MTAKLRPLTDYLRGAAGLTASRFLDVHDSPVLLWPQGEGSMEDTAFQFETIITEFEDGKPVQPPPQTESQIAKTLVIEIRKQPAPSPSKMICVGRAANNDIVLAHRTISKLHTYFLKSEHADSYEIVDANSTNGTKVNNELLVAYKNKPLANRDQIRFGPTIQMLYLTPDGFFELLQRMQHAGMV
jgi:hypothetical protein